MAIQLASRELPTALLWEVFDWLPCYDLVEPHRASKVSRAAVERYMCQHRTSLVMDFCGRNYHVCRFARRLTTIDDMVVKSVSTRAVRELVQWNADTLESFYSHRRLPRDLLLALSRCRRLTDVALYGGLEVHGEEEEEEQGDGTPALDDLLAGRAGQLKHLLIHHLGVDLATRLFQVLADRLVVLETYIGSRPKDLSLLRRIPTLTRLHLGITSDWLTVGDMVEFSAALPALVALTDLEFYYDGHPDDGDEEEEEEGEEPATGIREALPHHPAVAAGWALPCLTRLCAPRTSLHRLPPLRAPLLQTLRCRVAAQSLPELASSCPALVDLGGGGEPWGYGVTLPDRSFPRLPPGDAKRIVDTMLGSSSLFRWTSTLRSVSLGRSVLPASAVAALAERCKSLTSLDLLVHNGESPLLPRLLMMSLPRLRHLRLLSARAPAFAPRGEPQQALRQRVLEASLPELRYLEVALASAATFAGLQLPSLDFLVLQGRGVQHMDLTRLLRAAPRLSRIIVNNVRSLGVPVSADAGAATDRYPQCTDLTLSGLPGLDVVLLHRLLVLLPGLRHLAVCHLGFPTDTLLTVMAGLTPPLGHLVVLTVHREGAPSAVDSCRERYAALVCAVQRNHPSIQGIRTGFPPARPLTRLALCAGVYINDMNLLKA